LLKFTYSAPIGSSSHSLWQIGVDRIVGFVAYAGHFVLQVLPKSYSIHVVGVVETVEVVLA